MKQDYLQIETPINENVTLLTSSFTHHHTVLPTCVYQEAVVVAFIVTCS